ncbi:MAG TPA: hypothetical protein VLF67_01410, partial [Candidatus Saccharimonas sp.]|nr:hypothetical protein [Candidatus Saccharimonas sp.]
DFLVRVKNEGTVHEKVQGSIEVTDWLGHKVGVVPVNQHGGNVLPDSVRRFPSGDPNETMQFAQKALFGYYKANLKLTYLDGKEKLTGSLAFWVIPWKLILLVIVGLVALFFVLRLSIKRYNEHIIAQARKRG